MFYKTKLNAEGELLTINFIKTMKAKEYYKSTRMVDTMHWTLDMAMNFAEEYHKNEIEALRIHDVVGRSEQLICDTCKSGLINYPEIHRRTCRCGALGYNVTD
jgi:hypothetical protein